MALSYDNWKQTYSGLNEEQRKQYNDKIQSQGGDVVKMSNEFVNRFNQENSSTQSDNSSNFTNGNGNNGQNQNLNNGYSSQNFDPNETLDTNKFGATDGKVVVKEGTAQQTGKPDYELNSDARMQEITNNLNAYWQNNREFFKDRATFNQMFSYNSRSNEQKALLDSYWKKKEDESNIAKYTNADSVANGMKNAEITTDQMDLLRANNPELYAQWQKRQQDDIDLRIANFTTPADPTDNAELFNSLLQKLNLEPGDPYQIYDNWYNMAERLGVFSDSERLKSYQNQLDDNHSKMEAIMNRYASSTSGTVSDALAAARMQKALAPYQQREVDLQNSYTTLLNGRNSNLAIANQSAQALAMQAQEDQRIFNQRLSGLGFAMTTASYRTPEQQAQLQLQTQAISNDMALLQQSKMNDLSLYNTAATYRLQNQLQNEMYDLSVSDPTQLRNNLNNILSQYYDQYGMMIQRSQQQTLDDILKYAKDNNVSVAEALTQNFIKPLQQKEQYKSLLNAQTGYDPYANQQKYRIVQNADGTTSVQIEGVGEIPDEFTRQQRQQLYESWLSNATSLGDVGAILAQYQDGSKGGQCGAFVNDVAIAMGSNVHFGSALSEKINPTGDYTKSDAPVVGSFAVFKSASSPSNGHVGVVVKVNDDGSFVMKSSNRGGDEKIYTSTHKAGSALTFIVPEVNFSQNMQSYNENLIPLYDKYLGGQKSLTAEEWKTVDQAGMTRSQFTNQATNYKAQKDAQMTPAVYELISELQELKQMNLTNYATSSANIPRTKGAYYRSVFNKVKSSVALQNLVDLKSQGATFGALSDNELKFITDSATNLSYKLGYGDFMNVVDGLIEKLQKGVSSVSGGNVVNLDLSSENGSSTLFSDMMKNY